MKQWQLQLKIYINNKTNFFIVYILDAIKKLK